MRLVKFCIKGFRNYRENNCIELDNLTAIIGKNDAGESTILEAMDTYFNGTKLDSGDYAIGGTNEIRLTAYFGDLPEAIIIDEANPISLQNEYLLNNEGLLVVEKVYKGASPAHKETYIVANHPSADNVDDLLTLKIIELRQRAHSLGVDLSDVNGTIKSAIRQRIWSECVDLNLTEQKILIKDEDTKKIADKIEDYMPAYSLFKSDRPSTDQDEEAQDPMQAAIKEAMKAQEEVLNEIAAVVEREVRVIADQTVAKLRTMDIDLASQLTPVFKTDWSKVFKLSLTSDDAIPLNKRGSGVKRLILLNFFRAEAERRQRELHVPSIIYAIEEPETSQHPSHQRKLIEAFIALSRTDNTQIILTTHSPAIVKMLDFEHLKLIIDGTSKEILNIERGNLPYPSLNEVNFLAFGESNDEYHNELYGYIESEGELTNYNRGQATVHYNKQKGNTICTQQICMSEYIRHQIHHPENTHNARFTDAQLQQSICNMRDFIKNNLL